MPTNIEIKAVARNAEDQRRRAGGLADGPPATIDQLDTFFNVPHGRLKLREFGDGRGELIFYDRADVGGARPSDYVVVPTEEPATLKRVLVAALGLQREVSKRRELFLAGQTRIHFDEVVGLGSYIELEVVLRPDQPVAEGKWIAADLMARLGIHETDLVDRAYVDLLERAAN